MSPPAPRRDPAKMPEIPWCLELPVGRRSGRKVPTWGAVAERFDRCLGRVSLYVGERIHDPGFCGRIVAGAIEGNLDLLVTEHGEREELRRLTATADRLIATGNAPASRAGYARRVTPRTDA